ncbi:hypothetical protein [Sphingomonas sp.]
MLDAAAFAIVPAIVPALQRMISPKPDGELQRDQIEAARAQQGREQ